MIKIKRFKLKKLRTKANAFLKKFKIKDDFYKYFTNWYNIAVDVIKISNSSDELPELFQQFINQITSNVENLNATIRSLLNMGYLDDLSPEVQQKLAVIFPLILLQLDPENQQRLIEKIPQLRGMTTPTQRELTNRERLDLIQMVYQIEQNRRNSNRPTKRQ